MVQRGALEEFLSLEGLCIGWVFFCGRSVPIVQYLARRSPSGEIAPESTLPKPCVSHVKSVTPGCYSAICMYEFMLERVASMLGPLWNAHDASEKRT